MAKKATAPLNKIFEKEKPSPPLHLNYDECLFDTVLWSSVIIVDTLSVLCTLR